MLKNVKDPIKRAEAINSIVRSVSVIPDPIIRATYIGECARRLEVDERTLITQTNKYIAGDKEEQRKTAEREEQRQQSAGQQEDTSFYRLSFESTVERLIIQNIIRHGDEVIFSDLEAEDGSTVSLNVAQYVDYDLSQDNLSFSTPLYNKILREAVEHSDDKDFKADRYFLQHPDPEISQLATMLGIDSHQLSRSFERQESERDLRQRMQHLILDFRMDIVNQHMKEVQRQLKDAGSNMELIRELMEEYKQTQELRNALARQRGSDVIV
jgi:DNA primase